MKRKNTILQVQENNELMKFLLESLPELSRNNAKTLLSKEQIAVNDEIQKQFNYALNSGDQITVYWQKDREKISSRGSKGIKIIFEDDYIIAVEKEEGLLSIGTNKEKNKTAYSLLKDHVKGKDIMNKIFVVHRLDKDTSGVMIFAKSEDVQQKLQTEWHNIVTERKYLAVTEGIVKEKEGEIKSYLKENEAMVTFSSKIEIEGGKLAITRYKVLRTTKMYSLLEVQIETGRKNQIRAHLSSIGFPIAGDKKYGAQLKNKLGRLGLHAQTIRFTHPITGEKMVFESPMPEVFKKI